MSNKTCTTCKVKKPRDEFYKQSKPGKDWDCRDSKCKPCRIAESTERRRKTKLQCIEYLGGSCSHCGLVSEVPDVYDFHHLDPSQKDFSIGKNFKKFESVKEELDKCILLCANCHRIAHHNM